MTHQQTHDLLYTAKYCGLSRVKLMQMLRDDGVLGKDNLPTQKHINNGNLTVYRSKPVPMDGKYNTWRPRLSTRVTNKGLCYLFERYATAEAKAEFTQEEQP